MRAGIASFTRDLDVVFPWARLVFGNDPSNRAMTTEPELGSTVIAGFFLSLPTLRDTPERCETAIHELATLRARLAADTATRESALTRIDAMTESLARSATASAALVRRLSTLVTQTKTMFDAMEFGFLFDPTRKLFSIGYRVADNSLDPSCYDLLASEARLTSFIAIAKGDVPSTHWFHLGRALTPVDRGSALVSWSGSMFEYLMPALVMRSPSGSLLGQTYHLIVRRQIKYGDERGVPWGVSESAFNARDLEFTYQYSNFGVPGLGLKRGLSEDVVVAPYATALAAMIDPKTAAAEFRPSRRGRRERPLWLLRGARLHRHAGSRRRKTWPSCAPIWHIIRGCRWWRSRMFFTTASCARASTPSRIMQATELLLQERTPRDVLVARPRVEEVRAVANVRDLIPPVLRRFTSPHDTTPGTHLLSNGRYAVMVTTAGSGYSHWRDLAVTRWREDRTRDAGGATSFFATSHSGQVWSAGLPTERRRTGQL